VILFIVFSFELLPIFHDSYAKITLGLPQFSPEIWHIAYAKMTSDRANFGRNLSISLARGFVQLGLMRRRGEPLFSFCFIPPHQSLIRWAVLAKQRESNE
jgi:hypothetical protein